MERIWGGGVGSALFDWGGVQRRGGVGTAEQRGRNADSTRSTRRTQATPFSQPVDVVEFEVARMRRLSNDVMCDEAPNFVWAKPSAVAVLREAVRFAESSFDCLCSES